MRKALFLSLFILGLTTCRQASHQEATTTFLPVQLSQGYGPFQPSFSPIENSSRNSPQWAKTYHSVKGMPTHWRQTQVCHVILNIHQFVYQNALTGTMNWTDYTSLQKSWQWIPDTTKLSKRSIKCYVYVIKGFDDITGKYSVMVDTNNNLDFSDERPLFPLTIDPKDPYRYDHPLQVHYEVYQKGVIRRLQLPMVLKWYGSELLYNFPQYGVVSLQKEGKEHKLLVSSGFTRPDFSATNLVDAQAFFWRKQVASKDEIHLNDVVEIDGVRYRNKGVDAFNNWLVLEPVHTQQYSPSMQVGYAIQPFQARAFDDGAMIDLAAYRGQYVYLEFWATWCKGCVAEMPALVKIYQQTDRERVRFVGITVDSPQRLTTFLSKHMLPWPQVIADSTNRLMERYHVVGVPTSVLINPEGVVIGRNLSPSELQTALSKGNKSISLSNGN